MNLSGYIGTQDGRFYCPMSPNLSNLQKINSQKINTQKASIHKPLMIYFIYGFIGLFSFIPLSLTIVISFLTRSSDHLVTLPFTFENYSILYSPIFLKIFLRSLTMASITTLGCLLLAYPFSYILIKAKHQSALLLLIMIPFWTSSLVRTYALLSILKFNGILNFILLKFQIIQHPISFLYTHFAVLSGLIYNLFPFMVLPIFTHMERFDFRWLEAAKDLGAQPLTLFFKVFLPNTSKGIMAGCLLVLLPAMTLFYIPTVLGGARSLLLGNMIQDQFLVLENWPQGAATSTILTLIFLIAVFFLRKQGKDLVT